MIKIAEKIDWAARKFQTVFDSAPDDDSVPPLAKTEIGRLLWTRPPPLINPAAKLLVIFSAKSACTNVLVWFFHHLGHLKAARDFHVWPHEYRVRVYYQSQLYRRAYKDDFTAFKVVRVVRDPYERAASSFRQLVRHADSDFGRQARMQHVAERGLSFAEFLDFLERTDLTTCDPHFAIQRHPIEDRLPVHYLINVSKDDLFTRLNAVEADLGLPHTDLPAMEWIQLLRNHNLPAEDFKGGGNVYTHRFGTAEAKMGPWPRHADLLTAEARERIARLYAIDIDTYCQAS